MKEGKSPILPDEGREEERLGSLGRLFLYHPELGGGETIRCHLAPLTCGLWEGVLQPRGGAVPDYPQPSLPQTPAEGQYFKNSFSGESTGFTPQR